MKHLIIYLMILQSPFCMAQTVDSIFIVLPQKLDNQIEFISKIPGNNSSLLGSFLVSHTITPQSKKDIAAYDLCISKAVTARDSGSFNNRNLFTPAMIMDSLTKYREDYRRKTYNKVYVLIKGYGPIWYLHKAILLYIWSDPNS